MRILGSNHFPQIYPNFSRKENRTAKSAKKNRKIRTAKSAKQTEKPEPQSTQGKL